MKGTTISNKSICFVTTGDIALIASAKRALGLANYMEQLGWSVSILMEDTPENHHRAEMECDGGIGVYFFPTSDNMQERKSKEALLRKINPAVIFYCAFVGRNVVGRDIKAVKIVEHSELASKFKKLGWKRKLYYFALEFYSIAFADGILNASHYLQKVYKRRARRLLKGKMPMTILPYAYNKTVCHVNSASPLLARKPSGEAWFVFLGSLTENYGAFTMLEAFEKVIANNKNAKLFLLGKGHDYERVKDYVSTHKLEENIITPGYIKEEEISDYFSAADCFLLPLNDTVQDWARCPSKLYMYLAFNKPVITCRVGEPYEELGDNGIYYEPSDAGSLAKAVETFLGSGRRDLGLTPEKYEWKQRAEDLDKWINDSFFNKQ